MHNGHTHPHACPQHNTTQYNTHLGPFNMHNFLWLDSKRTSDFWVVEHPPSLGEPPTTRNNLPWNPSPCAQHSSLKPELLTEGMGMWSEFVGVNYCGGNPKPSSRDEQNNTKHSLRGGVSRAAHLHVVWVMIVSTPTKLRKNRQNLHSGLRARDDSCVELNFSPPSFWIVWTKQSGDPKESCNPNSQNSLPRTCIYPPGPVAGTSNSTKQFWLSPRTRNRLLQLNILCYQSRRSSFQVSESGSWDAEWYKRSKWRFAFSLNDHMGRPICIKSRTLERCQYFEHVVKSHRNTNFVFVLVFH